MLDFIKLSDEQRKSCLEVLHATVVREAVPLDENLSGQQNELKVVFNLFHAQMFK